VDAERTEAPGSSPAALLERELGTAGPTPPSQSPPPPRRKARRPGSRQARLLRKVGESIFIWPMLVLVGTLVLVPTAIAVWRSFYDWDPGYESPFVGLDNYRAIVESELVREIARNELVYLIGVPLWAGLPLVVALLMYERVPAVGVFRTIFFFPAVLSPVVIGILFRSLLRPDGLVNSVLGSVGLESLQRNWIDDPSLVKPVIICVVAWYSMGFGVLFYSAALSSIDPQVFEAAEIDGASWIRRLWHIMIPSILPMFVLNLVFSVGSVFLLFGYIYTLTQGGPGYSSTTIDFDIYQNALNFGDFALSSAESVVLLLIMSTVLTAAVFVGRRMWR
jgi:ABC-type sugar transport system permease subunit